MVLRFAFCPCEWLAAYWKERKNHCNTHASKTHTNKLRGHLTFLLLLHHFGPKRSIRIDFTALKLFPRSKVRAFMSRFLSEWGNFRLRVKLKMTLWMNGVNIGRGKMGKARVESWDQELPIRALPIFPRPILTPFIHKVILSFTRNLKFPHSDKKRDINARTFDRGNNFRAVKSMRIDRFGPKWCKSNKKVKWPRSLFVCVLDAWVLQWFFLSFQYAASHSHGQKANRNTIHHIILTDTYGEAGLKFFESFS
jgi:hypothetical protein